MRVTGIVRKVDELGRVVLPIELRRGISVDCKDALEISVNGDTIILSKYVPRCIFCKSEKDVIQKMGRHLCKECITGLKDF